MTGHKTYFDRLVLNGVGVYYKCDRQMDRHSFSQRCTSLHCGDFHGQNGSIHS